MVSMVKGELLRQLSMRNPTPGLPVRVGFIMLLGRSSATTGMASDVGEAMAPRQWGYCHQAPPSPSLVGYW